MSQEPQKGVSPNLFVYGLLGGMLVGTVVYGVTQWIPAIGFGPMFGVLVAIVIAVFQKR